MTFSTREASRSKGEPIELYLFGGAEPTLESMLRSVNVIPGATEFGYGTTRVLKDGTTPINSYGEKRTITDFETSLNLLMASASGLTHVSLVVAWHGTDLRCGSCEIRPKVETAALSTTPYSWQVGPTTRGTAQVVSTISSKPAIGGAPADRSVYEALTMIKARGLKVTLYPFILMDIPSTNVLPDPYGGSNQAAYPWRGRITCHPAPGQPGTVDKTAAAATQVNTFFGAAAAGDFGWNGTTKVVTYSGPSEWSYRRFILHMAKIAEEAGVDDFLIGSELIGLTSIRSSSTAFPAVEKLVALAADVKGMLGSGVRVSYGADWSEYHSYRPTDGSGDVFFNLDPLWSSADVDFIGIDAYFPLSDWRDTADHLDRQAGYYTIYDKRYLQKNIEGGEYYDWYYASSGDRTAQDRSPISDGAYDEPWVYRNKDIRNWWLNDHHNRPAGVRSGSPTDWTPQSKPIVFTEVGCGAVNKASNQPYIFVDPKSSESGIPYSSNGVADPAIQRAYLESFLGYWMPRAGNNPVSEEYDGRMVDVDALSVWTWDARPWPVFPKYTDVWGDAGNWARGHWITGRIDAGRDFDSGVLGPYAYTNAETEVTRDGVTYKPWPVKRDAVNASGSLDRAMLEVSIAKGDEFGQLYVAYPPSQVVNLMIRQGHVGDDPDLPANFPVVWTGRVLSQKHHGSEISFSCEPVSTSIRRPGLRRNYQLTCPHVLYGSQCRANREAATVTSSVVSILGNRITLAADWEGSRPPEKYVGGIFEWMNEETGNLELRDILRIEGDTIYLSAQTFGLSASDEVRLSLGCNHTMTDCAGLHANIHNYGGQPWLPLINPIGFGNVFY